MLTQSLSQGKSPLILMFFRGPGAGKRTQCSRISQGMGYLKLSVGDLLREEKKKQSANAKLIISSILENVKVPVDVIVNVLREAMEIAGWDQNKYVIEGFPRNVDDMKGWDNIIGGRANIQRVFALSCEQSILKDRVEKRVQQNENNQHFDQRYSTYMVNHISMMQLYG